MGAPQSSQYSIGNSLSRIRMSVMPQACRVASI